MPRDGGPAVKLFAFIEFENPRCAEEARRAMDGVFWRGQRIYVDWAKSVMSIYRERSSRSYRERDYRPTTTNEDGREESSGFYYDKGTRSEKKDVPEVER